MIIAADNLTGARPTVRRALEQQDGSFTTTLCMSLAEAGADWLDLNPGYLSPAQRKDTWRFLVQIAEAACDLTLMLDAARPDDLELGLSFCTRPPVLNMACAEEARLGPVLDLAAHHGLKVVGATMTHSPPVEMEQRLALAALLVEEAAKRGISGDQLIIDPVVMPLALPGGEAHAASVLGLLRAVPQLFDPPPARMIGLSNLTTASAGERAPFAAGPFLAAAWGAGLEVVLMDALDQEARKMLRLLNIFDGQGVFAPGEFA